jgi:hypothetical protein
MDDEFVLRRVPKSFVEPPLSNPPVSRDTFRPTEQDVEGLSVYRAEYHPDLVTILADIPDEAKRATYTIVRIAVADIRGLGLSVIPKDADLPGHAEIPELNRAARVSNRRWANEKQYELALRSVIVHSPPQPA